jgi:hypothetical protein
MKILRKFLTKISLKKEIEQLSFGQIQNIIGIEWIDSDKVTKFTGQYYITLSTSLAMYEKREIPKKRIIMATIFRLCSLITALRYTMSALINTDWMSMVMSDGNDLITHKGLFSMALALGAYVIFFIAVVLQINEMKYNFTLMDFLIKWKNKSVLPLSVRNTKKLTVIINTMTKLLMKQAFWPLVILWNSLAAYPTIMTYLEPNSNFMIVSIIFFQACFLVFSLQYFCIVCAGFVNWSLSFFYLIFKFKEIHQDIQLSIKQNNFKRLSQAINDHHHIVIQTHDSSGDWV